jgi:hypothetical protein
MTGDPFRRVQPGNPLQIPAAAYNAFLDAAAAQQRNQQTGVRSGNAESRSSTLIRVRNVSGRDLKQFEVLGIDAPIFEPQDALEAFRREITFRGVVPDEDEHSGRFVVLQEPVPNSGVGLAVVVGLTIARLHDPDDGPEGQYADVREDVCTSVRRRKKPIAPIVWQDEEKDSGDLRWVVIHLNPRPVTSTTTTCPPTQGDCLYEARFRISPPDETEWVLVTTNGEPVDRCAPGYACHPPTEPPTSEEAETHEERQTCCQVATTTTSSTTTTPGPCHGDCRWTWNNSSHDWNLTTSTCPSNCSCAPPQYCGSSDCETTRTDCMPGGAPAPVYCGGTTTSCQPGGGGGGGSGTTTTLSAQCVGCTWYFRFGQWHLIENNCRGPNCYCCGAPPGQGSECSVNTVTGCCSNPTPTTPGPTGCSGSCRWVWEPQTGRWVLLAGGCNPGTNGRPCQCAAPSFSGSNCNQQASTGCYSPTTAPPPPPPNPTTSTLPPCQPPASTTTPNPAGCSGTCRWSWNGTTWNRSGMNCGSQCDCPEPAHSGTGACETAETPCSIATTTSTTTSSTTTTTSAPNCCDLPDVWDGRFSGTCPNGAWDETVTVTRVGTRDEWTYAGVLSCGDLFAITVRCNRSLSPNCSAFDYQIAYPCAKGFQWQKLDNCDCTETPPDPPSFTWSATNLDECNCCDGTTTTTQTTPPPPTTTLPPTTPPPTTSPPPPPTTTTGAPTTTSTSNTTTPGPCAGSCIWRWDDDHSQEWLLQSHTCGGNCGCVEPIGFGAYKCEPHSTSCVPGGRTYPDAPCTTTTTTSTTTTTTSTTTTTYAPCVGNCLWKWDARSHREEWLLQSHGCVGPCGCQQPIDDGTAMCESELTQCVYGGRTWLDAACTTTTTTTTSTTTTTYAPCIGTCVWTWDAFSKEWELYSRNCPANCGCAEPPDNGSSICEQYTTGCLYGGRTTLNSSCTTTTTTTTSPPTTTSSTTSTTSTSSTTTTGPPTTTTTTTTAGPCPGTCVWTWDDRSHHEEWLLQSHNCPNTCGCVEPTDTGNSMCEARTRPCVPGGNRFTDSTCPTTTTTSPPTTTTTTGTTTTTTTPAPCPGTCYWQYSQSDKEWKLLARNCTSGCGCVDPIYQGYDCDNETTSCVPGGRTNLEFGC